MAYLSTLLVMLKRAVRTGHHQGRPCATFVVLTAPCLILYFLGSGPATIWMMSE